MRSVRNASLTHRDQHVLWSLSSTTIDPERPHAKYFPSFRSVLAELRPLAAYHSFTLQLCKCLASSAWACQNRRRYNFC